MLVNVIRDKVISDAQFGKIYIDDLYQCETLENAKTLIPCDTYSIGFRNEGGWFNKEKKKHSYKPFRGMLEIKNVNNRSFILIHPSNTTAEIEGCIAVGQKRDEANVRIYPSRISYYPLYQKIADQIAKGGSVSIKITSKGGEKDMGLINKIVSGSATELIKGVGGVLDNLHTSKDEKLEAERKIKELICNHESKLQQNVTDRWASDMKSDSWLSKNIRPLTLLFLIVNTMLLIFIDSGTIDFQVKSSWVDLLQLVLITVIGAYFGGRSLEKVKT